MKRDAAAQEARGPVRPMEGVAAMERENLAIRVTGVKKEYRLGQIGGGTLQNDLQSWWARVRGLEDPNSIIGSPERTKGDRFLALNGVDLEVRRGEALGIIGRNGAGKSTLLKLLSRVTAPTAGVIELSGRVTSMLEVGTGFHGEMTGRENVFMNGAILGMSRRQIERQMDAIIEFSEVGEFIDTPVKRYSSGMYVKLAFSVAAHLKSEIMIMDEVLAVGDMAFQRKCLSAMRAAAVGEGRTVLYVSHNMATIRQLCDRCIVMDEGKIVFDGDTDEAIRVYLGDRAGAQAFRDYRGLPRPGWLTSPKIYLLEATYLDRDTCAFSRDERIRVRLTWENIEDVEDASLRFEMKSADGTALATYLLLDCYRGRKGVVATLEFEVNHRPFVEGTYHTIYTFFQHDGMGGQMNIECMDGLDVEVTASATDTPLVWEPRNWGYLRMDDARVLSLVEEAPSSVGASAR